MNRCFERRSHRRLHLLMALLIAAVALSGCAARETASEEGEGLAVADAGECIAGAEDMIRIRAAGVLKIGVTDNLRPLCYQEKGEWMGFDAELAAVFARWLGVQAEYVEITWKNRVQLLQNGGIDCIWNGMTKTEALLSLIDCSETYLTNAQVIVMPKEQFQKYDAVDKCYHLLYGVEKGSSAQTIAESRKLRTVTYATQWEVLERLRDKACDAAIADENVARAAVGEGKTFDTLDYNYPLNSEELCVGVRKDSPLLTSVNDFLRFSTRNGTMRSFAKHYGLEEALAMGVRRTTEEQTQQ